MGKMNNEMERKMFILLVADGKIKKQTNQKARLFFWRRRRDSNPRTAFDGYTISNRARSTSYATSPSQLADSLNSVSFISITDEEQICKCFFLKISGGVFRRKRGRSEDGAVVIKSSGLSTEQMAGYIPIGSSAGEFAALQIPGILQ